jgi:large subunit ribosomal protein L6e
MYTCLFLFLGPYEVNGVPLRRVNQRYVIATTTKVPLDGVNVAGIDDGHFTRAKGEEKSSEGTVTSADRKAAQAAVDGALTKNVDKQEMMKPYLQAKFSMSKADKPHLMKF